MCRGRRECTQAKLWRDQAERHLRDLQAIVFERGQLEVRLARAELALEGVDVGPDPRTCRPPSALVVPDAPVAPCAACGAPIVVWGTLGAIRRYCGHACQMRAYRARRKLGVTARDGGAGVQAAA